MKEMREETAKARREDRERQDRLEERLKRAEENKTLPPNDRRGGERQTDRGMDNRGTGQGGGERKGQCRNQLMGIQCDARKCQYTHKSICRPYREKGRLGCYDRRCNLLHPYDCRSVKEGWICDRKQCHAWHDRWESKAPGTQINPFGAWNGGFFQTPPKGTRDKKEGGEKE